MTVLNFPPTDGEAIDGSFTYEENGVTYSWDGEKWVALIDPFEEPLYEYPGSGYSQTYQKRLEQFVTVKDYGAKGDGVTDDTAAIQAMAASHKYSYFPPGVYKVSTSEFEFPIYFGEGAALTVGAGDTFTIRNSITSPRQWIFRGDGDYSLEHNPVYNPDTDYGAGEDARHIHASWFGAFPTNSNKIQDMAPNIQKAITSLGNSREGIIEFDVGNYHIQSAVLVNRAIRIQGSGIRRTIFKIDGSGFVPFTTNGEGVAFKDIQFEHDTQLTEERAGPLVNIIHPKCAVERVVAGRSFQSIVIDSSECTVNDLGGFYNVAGSAGSSLLAVRGSKHVIYNVRNLTRDFGPECLVYVGTPNQGGSTSSTGSISVLNIVNDSPSLPFIIDGSNGNVSAIKISDVFDSSIAVRSGGKIVNLSGSNDITDVSLNKITVYNNVRPALECTQQSSGAISNLNVTSFTALGVNGTGIKLTRTSGELSSVILNSSVNLRSRSQCIEKTGTIGNLVIMPGVETDTYAPVAWRTSISNDSVYVIDRYEDKFASKFTVIGNNSNTYGMWRARAANGPALQALGAVQGLTERTGPLTGTTGVDGEITVSVDAGGKYYVENRAGANITVLIEITG